MPGAKNPPLLNQRCCGVDLRNIPFSTIRDRGFDLSYLIDAYQNLQMGERFFTPFFEKLVSITFVATSLPENRTGKSRQNGSKM
jgi:hypothetical protein